MKVRKIGVLSGGGDCPGINPAIKWVVKTALDPRLCKERPYRFEVLGIREGWRGLIARDFSVEGPDRDWVVPLDEETVRTWDRYGGTMLGTSRVNPFHPRENYGDRLLQNIRRLDLAGLIVIGGEDTLGVACELFRLGFSVVGIPKTIDKDIVGTDYTLGFESAVQVITEEIDRLRTTAGSHRRIFVVETMGRHSGWLALEGGESSGAYIILIPEHDFEIGRINELLREGQRRGTRYEIIVVAEGAKPQGQREIVRKEGRDSFGHPLLGGVAAMLADAIEGGTGIDTRPVALSHLQRGGAPCAYDRRMGRYFGIAAVDLIIKEQPGRMVGLQHGAIATFPLASVVGKIRTVDVQSQYDTLRYNGRRVIFW